MLVTPGYYDMIVYIHVITVARVLCLMYTHNAQGCAMTEATMNISLALVSVGREALFVKH